MPGIRKSIACVSLAGMLLGSAASGWGQWSPEKPELLSTPQATGQIQHKVVPYGSLDAVEESYRRGEARRRWAVERQGNLIRDMWWYNGWVSPHLGTLEDIYAFGSRRAARRAYRQGLAPVFTPWPVVPGDIYGYPYVPPMEHPLGHENIPTGPNGYIDRPIHEPPPPAAVRKPPPPPEPIPYPRPSSGGPREF